MKLKTEVLDGLIENLSKRTSKPAYPTGIVGLDNLVWGVHKKELLVVGGRPSHGKTSLMLQMAWGLAKNGIPTIVNSLEMSVEAIIERLFCIEYGLHGWRLRTGDAVEIKKAMDAKEAFSLKLLAYPIEIFDNKGKTIQSVEETLKEMKPETYFIDYVQKISSKNFGGKYEAISDYVVRLQSLAIEHDCAIVLSSQINRGGSKAENATDYMKGSGEIEESADTLLQCQWLFRDNPSHPDTQEYIVKAVKQRHGPCSHVALNFDAGSFRFLERDDLMARVRSF